MGKKGGDGGKKKGDELVGQSMAAVVSAAGSQPPNAGMLDEAYEEYVTVRELMLPLLQVGESVTGKRRGPRRQAMGIVVENMVEALEMVIMKRDFIGSYATENSGGAQSVDRGREGAVCWDVDEEPGCAPLDTWGRGAVGVTVRIRDHQGVRTPVSRGRKTPAVSNQTGGNQTPRGGVKAAAQQQGDAALDMAARYTEEKIVPSAKSRTLTPVESDLDAILRTRLSRQDRLKEESYILRQTRAEALAQIVARQEEIKASKGNMIPGYDHRGRVVEVKIVKADRMAPMHVEPGTVVSDPPTAEELEEAERLAKAAKRGRTPSPNPIKKVPQGVVDQQKEASPRVETPVYERETKSATTGLGQPLLFSLLNPAPGVAYAEGDQAKNTEPPLRDSRETMRRDDYKKSVGHENYKAQRPSTLLNSLDGRQTLNRTGSLGSGAQWMEESGMPSASGLGLPAVDMGSSQPPAWLQGGRPSLAGSTAGLEKSQPEEDRHLALTKGGDWGRNTTPNAPVQSPRKGTKASLQMSREALGGRLQNKVPPPRNRLPTLNPKGTRKPVPPLQEVSRVPW